MRVGREETERDSGKRGAGAYGAAVSN